MGIDFSLSRVQTARVAGRVLDAAGDPTTGGALMLMPSQRSASMTSLPVGAWILGEGRFEFPNVPPGQPLGQYVIQAYGGRTGSSKEGEFGSIPVSVNGTDRVDLVLHMSAGSTIRGRITFDADGGAREPARSPVELSPIPADFDRSPGKNWASADIHRDWTFEMSGVNGPRRLQLARAPAGWTLKQILVNGIDVTDYPLPFGRADQSLSGVEVVLTDRLNELNGTIADDHAEPVRGATLVVFSTDRSRWYQASRFVRKTVTGPDGAFTLAGLPLGSYYAAAVARLPAEGADAWQDPEFLATLVAPASSVTLGDGARTSLNLRLAGR
jgi:hypothetical protein